MIPFTKVNNTLSIFVGGNFETITNAHPHYDAIHEILFEAVDSNDDEHKATLEDEILELLDTGAALEEVADVRVENGQVFYQEERVDGYFVNKILEFVADDLPVSHLLAGFSRLQKNPSMRVRENLYEFLERGNIVWQEDGRFLAFKAVRSNFRDVHSGTFDNSPGAVVSMSRHGVDDDPNNTCSRGLHVCSYEYLNHFWGDKYVVVAVDPANVVSIPNDYDFTKMRVCEYEVLHEIQKENARSFHEDYYDEEDIEEDDYDEDEEYYNELDRLNRTYYPF